MAFGASVEADDEEDKLDGVSDPASDSAPCDECSASERCEVLWISSMSPMGGRDLHLNGPILRASQMQVSGYLSHNFFVSFVLQNLVDIYER